MLKDTEEKIIIDIVKKYWYYKKCMREIWFTQRNKLNLNLNFKFCKKDEYKNM